MYKNYSVVYMVVVGAVLAYRDCTADGTWWRNPQNKTWSNYTACINIAELTVSVLAQLF